jgi:hypothetical protein
MRCAIVGTCANIEISCVAAVVLKFQRYRDVCRVEEEVQGVDNTRKSEVEDTYVYSIQWCLQTPRIGSKTRAVHQAVCPCRADGSYFF